MEIKAYFLIIATLVIFSIYKDIYTCSYTLKYLIYIQVWRKDWKLKKKKSLPSEVILGITRQLNIFTSRMNITKNPLKIREPWNDGLHTQTYEEN